ncbi:MAG: thiamine diphosphokinase [Desulfosporosinus sp.]|jgi:thiamine pyrophosphokinase
MKIAVLANGTWDLAWGRQVLKDIDYLICADGGADHAILSGRLPDLLIGDLDSVTPESLKQCKNSGCGIKQFPCKKDETDLELALIYAEEQARRVKERDIWLYGATGKRLDHFMGNIALMLAYARKGYRIRLIDPEHECWILQNRECIRRSPGSKISLIVLTERAVVTTEGLYYPLRQEVLWQDSPRGISNVFLGEEAVIQVDYGWVMVVLISSDT